MTSRGKRPQAASAAQDCRDANTPDTSRVPRRWTPVRPRRQHRLQQARRARVSRRSTACQPTGGALAARWRRGMAASRSASATMRCTSISWRCSRGGAVRRRLPPGSARGTVRRLTHGARLTDVDVSPDGTRVAAVHINGGARHAGGARSRATGPGADVTAIAAHLERRDGGRRVRIAPGGRLTAGTLAAERRSRGGLSEIVARRPRHTRRERAWPRRRRDGMSRPPGRPDGRALLFASDRSGGPFDLYRVGHIQRPGVDDGPAVERLTAQAGGARAPDVSPMAARSSSWATRRRGTTCSRCRCPRRACPA